MTTLYLARHGQSAWNNQRRITGQSDPGLSERGRAQSEAMAQCLSDAPLAAIYVSALRRTAETAQPTARAKQLLPVALPALNEIHLGALEGRFRDERDPDAQAWWARWQADMWGCALPGAERFAQLAQRVGRALDEIVTRHAGQQVLVVGHRGTNRVLMGTLMGLPRGEWPALRLRHKHLYRLRLGAGRPDVATAVLGGERSGHGSPRWRDGFVM
jgi:broad specificity phosphatase PhoE